VVADGVPAVFFRLFYHSGPQWIKGLGTGSYLGISFIAHARAFTNAIAIR
jgi:hypothetical protein